MVSREMQLASEAFVGTGEEILARLERAELLLEVSRRVAAASSLDEMLDTIIDIAVDALDGERGSLFLYDEESGELYSRVAQGNLRREIRVLSASGFVGHVFTKGEPLIVADAYSDPRFNKEVDQQTGFVTRNVICAPVLTAVGERIGVIEVLNKRHGPFKTADLEFLDAITSQAAVALQSTRTGERNKRRQREESEFLKLVADFTSELELGKLLQRVMEEATRLLHADRSTLFLNDAKNAELFSRVAQGDSVGEIRFPNHLGIAGTVFTSGESINIPYAYADLRFNPAFDKKTGYFTQSILCVPVVNKVGRIIGVTQVLNKHGGPFTEQDETRLRAFTAQIAIALENAQLFEDVQNMKNYNESILESMSSAVLTIDQEGEVVTCNGAGRRLLAGLAAEPVGQIGRAHV